MMKNENQVLWIIQLINILLKMAAFRSPSKILHLQKEINYR